MIRSEICLVTVLVLLVSFCAILPGARAEGGFSVKPVKDVVSFDSNTLRVEAPEAGHLTVIFGDKFGDYRHLSADVPAGISEIAWDGLADDGQKLGIFNNLYTLRATLLTGGGAEETFTTTFQLARPLQTLLFALPSAPVLYLGGAPARDRWFVEMQALRLNEHTRIQMQVCRADDPDTVVTTRAIAIKSEEAFKYYWDGTNAKTRKPLPAGDYVLTFWMDANPDYRHTFPVTLADGAMPTPPVEETGEIMPRADMTDEELWALMMQPSVVVDITDRHHQPVYAGPSTRSASLGDLHGQSQCLQVLAVEDNWARVSAWVHDSNELVEGYVPLSRLKVVQPQGPYGVLVDKRAQTLTLFENGRRMTTLSVSTGLPTQAHPERETTPGCFLTSERIGNFATDRRHYFYVIRYDGGNLIHSIGFQTVNQRADFREQWDLLGQKASHGCIRVPSRPTNESGVDAWWLYTHLPYHTRVIVLDDTAD